MDLGSSFLAPIAKQQEMDQNEALASQRAAIAPAILAHQLGLNKLQAAQTDEINAKLEGNKKAAAAMAQAASTGLVPGNDAPISQKLMQLAGINAQAGRVAQAGDMMKAASAAAAHEETQRAAIVRQGVDTFKAQAAKAQAMATTLDGVTDPDSWAAANDTYERQFKEPSPFRDVPYDPQFVAHLQSASMTAYQKAQISIRQADELSKEANRRSAMGARAAAADLAERKLELARQKAAADKKVAGKDVGAPNRGETDAAGRMISAEGLAEGSDLERAAFDVAAQARGLRKGNPGMTADDALRLALDAKKASGDFTPGKPGGLFGIGKVAPKYEPLPTSKGAKLEIGTNYRNPSGRILAWTKSGWAAAGGTSNPRFSSGRVSGGTADEPEDGADDDEEE